MKKIVFLILPAVYCLFLLGAACSMAGTEDIMANILNFNEKEFYSADRSVWAKRESQLLAMDSFGLAVNAPRRILTANHYKLPLIMAILYSGERGWDVSLADNCILVGTNLQDGSVHFANGLISEKELQNREEEEKAPKGPKPSGLATAAAQLTELDPKGRLPITWNTGTWGLAVINYDWPSNTVVVEFQGDDEFIPSPAKPVNPEPDPRGAAFMPWYLPTAKTPKPPESGLTFTGEFKVENKKQELNIFGSFAVPACDFHLPKQSQAHKFLDGHQENIAAVVPVTLAVLGLDWEEPIQFDWAVPVYGESLTRGMLARGNFSINALATETKTMLDPGKYLCYIVMNGKIFGPKTIEVSEHN